MVGTTRVVAATLISALLAGCASNPPGNKQPGEEQEIRMGVVESVRQVPLPGSSGTLGVIGGGTVGGIAGGRVGGGRGSQAASTVGAVAGSVAGYALESAATSKEGLEISVRLDSGQLIAIVQPDGEAFKPGERVRVLSGTKGSRVTH